MIINGTQAMVPSCYNALEDKEMLGLEVGWKEVVAWFFVCVAMVLTGAIVVVLGAKLIGGVFALVALGFYCYGIGYTTRWYLDATA